MAGHACQRAGHGLVVLPLHEDQRRLPVRVAPSLAGPREGAELGAGVQALDAFCWTLEIMLCFDQLSLGSLACVEYVCRQIQLVEKKHTEKVGSNANTEIVQEQHLFGGHSSRTNLCICPDLSAWIAEGIKSEAAVMKERRKAHEERALQKPAAKS